MIAAKPTAERARHLFTYDPDTGILRWRVHRGGFAKAGSVAGTLDSHGHRQVRVDRRLYMAHQIIWLFVTGEWPEFEIDHRDNDRDNNRFANFRPATQLLNARNRRMNRNNKSGFKGTYFNKRSGRWIGQIKANRVTHRLGEFDSPEAAHAAYAKASAVLHGEFGRTA